MATSTGTADSPSVIFAYAIYTRQSRVRNDITLSSCDVQFQICRDHAEAVFPPAIPWCGTRYDDPGQSGEDLERPALQALLAEIEKGTISHVIVYRLDRLSRRLADTVQILDTFKRHAVDLKIVTAPSLADSATSHFMLNILASFAEFEHGLISERIKESVRGRRRRGQRLSGKPPLGYDLPEQGKELVVNDDEGRKVRKLFQLAASGQTPRQIAEYANKRGWTTKVYVSRSTGKSLGGKPWTARQILELLRNPVYAGLQRDGKGGRRPGRHRAIVKPERFDDVQSLIDSRRPATRERHKHDLPLKGKVFCTACGRVMSPHIICNRHKKHIRYMHYRCRSHAGGRPPCKNASVPAAELRKFVLDTMRDPGGLEDEPGLTAESRQALKTIAWLIDWLSVPDPYHAIGNVVERIVFSRETIRVEFSETAIKKLLAEPRCDPRLPITGGQIDRPSGD